MLAPLPEEAIRWHRHRSPPLSLVILGNQQVQQQRDGPKSAPDPWSGAIRRTRHYAQGAPGGGGVAGASWNTAPAPAHRKRGGAFSPQPNLRPRSGPGAARGPTQQILAGVRPVPATRLTGRVHEGTPQGSPGGVPGPNQDGPARSRSKPRRLRDDSGGADFRSSRPAGASRSPSTRSGDRGSGCAHPLAARSRLNSGTGFHPGA